MRIIHVAAEIAPIAKVGGLADVIYGLARAQIKAGLDVTVILPKYHSIDIKLSAAETFHSRFGNKKCTNTLWKGNIDGIPLLLIEPIYPKKWFARGSIYEKTNIFQRFLYFSRAAYDYIRGKKLQPDIVHLHDWHTSALANLIDENMIFPPKLVTTVHNFSHQGKCTKSDFKLVGLAPRSEYTDSFAPSKINLLKAAIVASDHINTVSPTYAKEVLSPQYGCGLEQILVEYGDKFSGILNGIDYDYWNPNRDGAISRHYSVASLERRGALKLLLRGELGLSGVSRPLIAAVTRLDPQKGVKFLEKAIAKIPSMGGQFVLLGTSPFPSIQKQFLRLQKEYRGHPHVRLIIDYDEELSHRIYAGADLLIVPSLFEPCGLTQLIALRYGCVPLVRATGGLADTVTGSSGFSFKKPTIKSFIETLEEAISLWYKNPKHWQKLQRNGMSQDFSWNTACQHYLDMYRGLGTVKK